MQDTALIHEYMTWLRMRGLAETTIDARAGALRRLSRHIGGHCLIRDAGRDHFIGWRASLAGKADSYILAQVSHVRCYLTWLCEEGHRDDDPGRHIPVPRKPEPLPRPIGEHELRTAIDHADERIRLWLILAAFCGLRAKEIACLRRKYIREHDSRNPHIFIAADATKGRHEAVVPLRGYALAEIRAARLPATGWAWPRLDGQPGPLTPHRVSSLCNTYLHELGYPDTLHSLRHYFGTEILRQTGNVRTAMRALRHRRLDTTAIYTLITDDEVAAAVALIPAPRRLRAAS